MKLVFEVPAAFSSEWKENPPFRPSVKNESEEQIRTVAASRIVLSQVKSGAVLASWLEPPFKILTIAASLRRKKSMHQRKGSTVLRKKSEEDPQK